MAFRINWIILFVVLCSGVLCSLVEEEDYVDEETGDKGNTIKV